MRLKLMVAVLALLAFPACGKDGGVDEMRAACQEVDGMLDAITAEDPGAYVAHQRRALSLAEQAGRINPEWDQPSDLADLLQDGVEPVIQAFAASNLCGKLDM